MLSEETLAPMGMSQKLKTAPAATPVSLSEVKEFLRIDHNAEDTSLTILLNAAVARVERFTNLKLINQTWLIYFDHFPTENFLNLRAGPLSSITSVKYSDENGTQATFSSANYIARTSGQHGEIILKLGMVWPDTVLQAHGGVEVECVLGHGAAGSNVPEALRQAVLEVCAALYDGRGNSDAKPIPAIAAALCGAYRVAP